MRLIYCFFIHTAVVHFREHGFSHCIFAKRRSSGTINTFFAAELRIITGLLNN